MKLRLLFLSLFTAVVATALVACAAGGRAKQATMAPSDPDASAPPLSGRPDELRAKIAELGAAIERDLDAAQVDRPDATAAAQMAATPMADVRTTCDHVPSDRCEDVCKLSGSICDNAASICDLAAQLPGDAWAEERCGAAKAACQRASERCCAGECAPVP
ncbi:MAG: hypothetical protein K8M05_37725 [Deltaproteobacteria bacterium]|nr:hypothetical protein [Kofleriaceae bacterium]